MNENKNVEEVELKISNYEAVKTNMENNRTGGVLTYIRQVKVTVPLDAVLTRGTRLRPTSLFLLTVTRAVYPRR